MNATTRSYSDPDRNLETERFWEAAAEGTLLLKRCRACGETHYYPRAICPICFSGDTEWVPASGNGRIYSYSVMRRTEVPYVIAYVTLAEGVTIMSNIVDCDIEKVAIDQEVTVVFKETEGGTALPLFTPVSA
ncbi:MAG: Zn-ribbon domain-containing OB-fold protein [Alphaproteobacteria bacterium]|jgi:hypothetical protein|nr:Zn-ribbon domain-containing OB-fold protein [Alphaproteobacteria bacterium]